MRFRNRADAGRALGERLQEYRGRDDVIVLALPRGGVPVAAEVARAIEAPLDVLLVRKLGVPGHEELAFGALASGGVRGRTTITPSTRSARADRASRPARPARTCGRRAPTGSRSRRSA